MIQSLRTLLMHPQTSETGKHYVSNRLLNTHSSLPSILTRPESVRTSVKSIFIFKSQNFHRCFSLSDHEEGGFALKVVVIQASLCRFQPNKEFASSSSDLLLTKFLVPLTSAKKSWLECFFAKDESKNLHLFKFRKVMTSLLLVAQSNYHTRVKVSLLYMCLTRPFPTPKVLPSKKIFGQSFWRWTVDQKKKRKLALSTAFQQISSCCFPKRSRTSWEASLDSQITSNHAIMLVQVVSTFFLPLTTIFRLPGNRQIVLGRLRKLPIPPFRTHFLFRRISRLTAKIPFRILLLPPSTLLSSKGSDLGITRKLAACNPEDAETSEIWCDCTWSPVSELYGRYSGEF